MLTVFILVAVLALTTSALCSLMESALFAVPLPHVKHLADKGSKQGDILLRFKDDMRKPISTILILNTISNTCGAAFAGAIAGKLWGEPAVVVFSITFTLLILYLSEIIPKQIGGSYPKKTAEIIARPLDFLTRFFSPLVQLTDGVSKYFEAGAAEPSISEAEVLSMAKLGTEEGVLDHLEGSVIRNIVGLDRRLVKDILTPRVVVFRIREDLKIGEIQEELLGWNFSRVPLFSTNDPEQITGYVLQRDIFRTLLRGESEATLKELSRPMTTVSEFMRADQLLQQMFSSRESICSVVDEHGAFAGLVTLEDVIEEIVGREIVDEYDLVTDLRSYARILYNRKKREIKKM